MAMRIWDLIYLSLMGLRMLAPWDVPLYGAKRRVAKPAPAEPAWIGMIYSVPMGMIGFDEGSWDPAASREAPSSQNQRTKQVPKARTTRLSPSLHKLGE